MSRSLSPESRRRSVASAFAPESSGSALAFRRTSANFWREFMYWWTGRFPEVVRLTRPFFLWFALRFSRALFDGPMANARRILGSSASEQDVDRLRADVVRSAYTSIYELGRALRSTPEQLQAWVERIEGRERYLSVRRAGRGAILLTAHLGPFEIGATALLSQESRIHVLYRRDQRASFDRLRSRLRARLGIHEVPIDDGWSVWAKLRDALTNDEVVLIQGDRVMPGHRGVPVRFFDGHILMPTGPVKLAKVAAAPIIPVFSIRTRVGRCAVMIDEPLWTSPEPETIDGEHPVMRRFAEALERQVRAYPEQWAVYERAWCEDQREMPVQTG